MVSVDEASAQVQGWCVWAGVMNSPAHRSLRWIDVKNSCVWLSENKIGLAAPPVAAVRSQFAPGETGLTWILRCF